MKIGIVGASGLVGSRLAEIASSQGYDVVGFSRSKRADTSSITWRVWNEAPDLSGLDAVCNFAGELIAQRWTEEKKKEFYKSRVGVTNTIVKQIKKLSPEARPSVLVNASAVGYYGDCRDQKLEETSPSGSSYLSQLTVDWENAAIVAEQIGVRVVRGRIGIVIGKDAPAWEKMATVFKLGIGGPLGNGEHWMPWVHVDDVAQAALFSCTEPSVSGAVNFVSPEPVKNREFTTKLARAVNRPALFPAPKFALQLVFGQFGEHLLDSYRAYPEVLQKAGYSFHYPELEKCLEQLV